MTSRERFHETMHGGRPDHVPWLEEGLRDDVLEAWREQGLSEDSALAETFRYDRRERIELDLAPRPQQNDVPATRAELSRLARGLDPEDPARLPKQWNRNVDRWRKRDHLLELPIHRGLFLSMGANDWGSLERLLYLIADDPLLVREAMDRHAAFAAKLADRILSQVTVDFASFSEPISGSHGPLISPETYRRWAVDSYKPVLDVLRRHGVETIVFITWANSLALLQEVVAAGFNCLWAMETNGMDYRWLRHRFGKSLRLIGGIDLDCLTRSQEAIEREIMTKVPPLLAEGGYVPLADGRVRANIPFENFLYYRRLLEQVTQVR